MYVRCHYGTMEVSTIGYESGKHYEIYDNSTFVEVLDEQGENVREGEGGNIYVTSLHNHVMPFVNRGLWENSNKANKAWKNEIS